jgi:HEAT repeat protein
MKRRIYFIGFMLPVKLKSGAYILSLLLSLIWIQNCYAEEEITKSSVYEYTIIANDPKLSKHSVSIRYDGVLKSIRDQTGHAFTIFHPIDNRKCIFRSSTVIRRSLENAEPAVMHNDTSYFNKNLSVYQYGADIKRIAEEMTASLEYMHILFKRTFFYDGFFSSVNCGDLTHVIDHWKAAAKQNIRISFNLNDLDYLVFTLKLMDKWSYWSETDNRSYGALLVLPKTLTDRYMASYEETIKSALIKMSKKDLSNIATTVSFLRTLFDLNANALRSKDIFNSFVKAFAKNGNNAVLPFITILKDNNPQSRDFASAILAEIGAPAVKPLINSLREGGQFDSLFRKNVARILGEIGNPAVTELVAALKDKNVYVRKYSIIALGNIGNEELVTPLINSLKGRKGGTKWDPFCREVAQALARIGEPAVEPVVVALSDKNEYVSSCAELVFGNIYSRDERSVDLLIKKLETDELGSRLFAIRALGTPNNIKAVEPLINILKNDTSYQILHGVAMSLAMIHIPSVMPLINILPDADKALKGHILDALSKIGTPAVFGLAITLKGSTSRMRSSAALALGEVWKNGLRNKLVVDELIAVLNDKDLEVRKAAVISLGNTQAERAIIPLVSMLKDINPDIQSTIFSALARIGTPSIKPLIDFLKSENPFIMEMAIIALGKIGNKVAEKQLYALLGNPNYPQEAVLDALTNINKDKHSELTAEMITRLYSNVLGITPSKQQIESALEMIARGSWQNNLVNNFTREHFLSLGKKKEDQIRLLISYVKQADSLYVTWLVETGNSIESNYNKVLIDEKPHLALYAFLEGINLSSNLDTSIDPEALSLKYKESFISIARINDIQKSLLNNIRLGDSLISELEDQLQADEKLLLELSNSLYVARTTMIDFQIKAGIKDNKFKVLAECTDTASALYTKWYKEAVVPFISKHYQDITESTVTGLDDLLLIEQLVKQYNPQSKIALEKAYSLFAKHKKVYEEIETLTAEQSVLANTINPKTSLRIELESLLKSDEEKLETVTGRLNDGLRKHIEVKSKLLIKPAVTQEEQVGRKVFKYNIVTRSFEDLTLCIDYDGIIALDKLETIYGVDNTNVCCNYLARNYIRKHLYVADTVSRAPRKHSSRLRVSGLWKGQENAERLIDLLLSGDRGKFVLNSSCYIPNNVEGLKMNAVKHANEMLDSIYIDYLTYGLTLTDLWEYMKEDVAGYAKPLYLYCQDVPGKNTILNSKLVDNLYIYALNRYPTNEERMDALATSDQDKWQEKLIEKLILSKFEVYTGRLEEIIKVLSSKAQLVNETYTKWIKNYCEPYISKIKSEYIDEGIAFDVLTKPLRRETVYSSLKKSPFTAGIVRGDDLICYHNLDTKLQDVIKSYYVEYLKHKATVEIYLMDNPLSTLVLYLRSSSTLINEFNMEMKRIKEAFSAAQKPVNEYSELLSDIKYYDSAIEARDRELNNGRPKPNRIDRIEPGWIDPSRPDMVYPGIR